MGIMYAIKKEHAKNACSFFLGLCNQALVNTGLDQHTVEAI